MIIFQAHNAHEFEMWANSGEIGAVALTHDTPCVWTGKLSNTLDMAACERRKLYVGRGQYHGGSIVNMAGDLSMCIVTPHKSDIAKSVVDAVAEWLMRSGAVVTRDGNDVLADGKKVVSWARAKTGATWQSVVHFSIGKMDLELVREICTKPMEKIPGSLNQYGVDASELRSIAEGIITGSPDFGD